MRYTIVTHPDEEDFLLLVNRHISEGWKPQGGLIVQNYRFYQAMVRE